MKRFVVIAVVSMLVTAGLGGSASARTVSRVAPAVAPAAIEWGRCSEKFMRQAHARCAMLDVPLDYAQPNGAQIQIAVSRIKHTVPNDEYQGVMLVNPGGPGGSGFGLVTLGSVRAASTRATPTTGSASTRAAWGRASRRSRASRTTSTVIVRRTCRRTDELEARGSARSERYADACGKATLPNCFPTCRRSTP